MIRHSALHLAEFTKAYSPKLARDIDGKLVYLADPRVNLSVVQESWPKVAFHDPREHGQRDARECGRQNGRP